MATLIIKDKHKGRMALPHYLLINDRIVGLMKGEARINVPAATFKVTVRSSFKFIESSAIVSTSESLDTLVEFGDREKVWDIIFWADMALWLVKRLLDLPQPWGLVYEILSNGFFAVWLLRVWIIRKKYFKVEVYRKIGPREDPGESGAEE
ncbi:MAG: hypothetical protein ACI399_08285 [Candidatus Cryptobacteroides sp.]